MIRFIALLAFISLPLVAWAVVKPVRVVAPELLGVTCHVNLCIDDASRLDEAQALYDAAVLHVDKNVAHLSTAPRAVFCSSWTCANSFGLQRTGAAAYDVGTIGMVIGPRAWRPFFVRHEIIHHLQNERLGSINTALLKPTWFREGMAYSLSGDPRRPLPQPLQGYRAEFETWLDKVGRPHLWDEAAKL
jgi:hypothetical protein